MKEKKKRDVSRSSMSKLRKRYMVRLVGRSFTLVIAALLLWKVPSCYSIAEGDGFFRRFSPFHILWGIWIVDMVLQLVPVREKLPLGSQKHLRHRFRPILQKINTQSLRDFIIATTKAAYRVFALWFAVVLVLGILYYARVLRGAHLLLITIVFYVCDLICVLIWCPFRLIMKNRCCTTCRIYNWDHLMMFSPMLFLNSFFSVSLLLMAFSVWVVWELCVMLYPERFWEMTNESLQCSQCTDKLCTQYCRKIRPS